MIRIFPRGLEASAVSSPGERLNPRLRDPRLSKSQVDALIRAATEDPAATVLGLDERMQPVVRARLPGPNGEARYALLRNGGPTKVYGKLAEAWK